MTPWFPPLRAAWTDGALARVVEANRSGRLTTFVRDSESEPLALFSPEWRARETSGDWYGEHAGKWLVAASAAYVRTSDEEIGGNLRNAVDFLLGVQEPNGYLGTYAPESRARFTHADAEKGRTWDLWIHAWLMLGLLDASRALAKEAAQSAAMRIGDLILESFLAGERSVLDRGNHSGLSSAILIQPLARLTLATGEPRYAAFARRIVDEMEGRGLRILSDAGGDPSTIGTGKIYQLLWVLLGMATLTRATGDRTMLEAVGDWTDSISAQHLNPLGGPWGGLGGHKEVFAPSGAFDPGGLVETCSTATWIELNRELALLTGEVKYAERVERSLLNALLGAALASGEDWTYFTLANGRRTATYHWACCKSSGAMALERSSLAMMSRQGNTIRIEIPLSGEATFEVDNHEVTVSQRLSESGGSLEVRGAEGRSLELQVRIPEWARPQNPEHQLGRGESVLRLTREWRDGERLEIPWETPIRVHPFTHSIDHHGQEIVRDDYAFVSRGPWVYATGLYEGFRKQETIRLPRLDPVSPFRLVPEDRGEFAPRIDLLIPSRRPIELRPYAEAGGRTEGGWRNTWLGVAWQ